MYPDHHMAHRVIAIAPRKIATLPDRKTGKVCALPQNMQTNTISDLAPFTTLTAIEEHTTFQGTKEATVLTYSTGQVDYQIKRYQGRGCLARAAKYARAEGLMVEAWQIRALATEVWNRFVK